ncbi:GrpB family protein [Chromobacterium vaccinii]|uniref:GrpB family protein n=1 Tax=Chromobacterium vaccinii TaxID=1108595 RepID=UPI000E12A9B4|nr:GrpB family protein [Chromobacterium vaccinii]SUX54300.1 dephospho-CoA kinase/protein folding accessory domain-containing protein [Chromobacterium vaccinii]
MIEIVPHQPRWAAEFQTIASQLRAALGELALRIDHIGSTAVPGLAAKDVIDAQITVAELDEHMANRLSAAGFERKPFNRDHLPPGRDDAPEQWSKFFFREPAGQRRAHIHVRRAGSANQRYALLFRDYLRAQPAMAAAYGELKRRLASSLADWETYPDVKDPAVDLIYLAAEQWAERSGWRQG